MAGHPSPGRTTPKTLNARAWADWWSTAHGRRAIGALFAKYGLYTDSGTLDPVQLAREAGQRQVLLDIAEMIRLKPVEFPADAELVDAELQAQVDSLMTKYDNV